MKHPSIAEDRVALRCRNSSGRSTLRPYVEGNVGPEADAARREARATSSGARLVLTGLSRISSGHAVRNAG